MKLSFGVSQKKCYNLLFIFYEHFRILKHSQVFLVNSLCQLMHVTKALLQSASLTLMEEVEFYDFIGRIFEVQSFKTALIQEEVILLKNDYHFKFLLPKKIHEV